MDMDDLAEFVFNADLGLSTKDDILAKIDEVEQEVAKITNTSVDSKTVLEGGQEAIEKKRAKLEKSIKDLEEILSEYKNFNKSLCFANIRELLRQNPDVKIGQIEKEAGIRLGYMSRLEKDGNTSEPSMEFIVSAAKLLHVSIDTLISVDIVSLTPTEQYLVKFFDKLKADTLADKLDWIRESAFNLNRMEPDINGNIAHPLFSVETFYEESECDYPNEVTRTVFSSNTFGPTTYINDDCFNLRLKNGTILYLMDIEKSVHRHGDPGAYAKEAWVHVPYKGSQLLITTQSESPIAPQLKILFDIVKSRMEHPKINKDVMSAIDAFMKDDFTDDYIINDDDIPF